MQINYRIKRCCKETHKYTINKIIPAIFSICTPNERYSGEVLVIKFNMIPEFGSVIYLVIKNCEKMDRKDHTTNFVAHRVRNVMTPLYFEGSI